MKIFFIILNIFYIGCNYINSPQISRDEPLILTDYLNKGQGELARELSRVEPIIGNAELYAGFFRVSTECTINTYFWYFPAENGNTSAPILVWLQGGPGASSIYGAFVENGPYFFNSDDELKLREISWTKEFSVIYIDNPVGSGFSFSDIECYLTNEEQIGYYLTIFMQQFYLLFPELRINPLYITGESYAGKYIPAMVSAIDQYNWNNPTPINLVGMAIGNGFSDPYNMYDYGTYLYNIGLIFDNQIGKFDNLNFLARQNIEAGNFYRGSEYYDEIFDLFYELTGLTNYYNYILDGEAPYQNYIDFVNKNSHRFNAGNLTFCDDCDLPYQKLYEDFSKSMAPTIQNVLNLGYKTLFYTGQVDVSVPYIATSAFLRELNWTGKEEFLNAPQQIWYSTSGSRVNGYYKTAGNLMQLIVRDSGHMVPTDQPEAGVEMLKLFIYGF